MESEKVKECEADRFETLNVGCNGGYDTMEFQSTCGTEFNSGAYTTGFSFRKPDCEFIIPPK